MDENNVETLSDDYRYSSNWKNIGSVLSYKSNDFQFKTDIIITELEGCIINHISQHKLYNNTDILGIGIGIFDEDLVKYLKKCDDKSIVIISNHINNNKLNMDIIKRKVEYLVNVLHIPILCFFATKVNFFMKPHTGCWRLLNTYYRKYGNTIISKACVVSNEGGLLKEFSNKNGKTYYIPCTTDIDRAFSHNINIPYYSIDEYLGISNKIEFKWDKKIIPPNVRKLYIDEIKKYNNPDIFKELMRFGKYDNYMIMISGAPCSGKTRLAKYIIEKWRSSTFGEYNAIELLSSNEYTKSRRIKKFKSFIDDRISVILDGNCHNDYLRYDYLQYIKTKNIPVLYIDVNCGLEMAKVFNHSRVEDAISEDILLYKYRDYNIYKAEYQKPTESIKLKYTMYIPSIEETDSVIKYRY